MSCGFEEPVDEIFLNQFPRFCKNQIPSVPLGTTQRFEISAPNWIGKSRLKRCQKNPTMNLKQIVVLNELYQKTKCDTMGQWNRCYSFTQTSSQVAKLHLYRIFAYWVTCVDTTATCVMVILALLSHIFKDVTIGHHQNLVFESFSTSVPFAFCVSGFFLLLTKKAWIIIGVKTIITTAPRIINQPVQLENYSAFHGWSKSRTRMKISGFVEGDKLENWKVQEEKNHPMTIDLTMVSS